MSILVLEYDKKDWVSNDLDVAAFIRRPVPTTTRLIFASTQEVKNDEAFRNHLINEFRAPSNLGSSIGTRINGYVGAYTQPNDVGSQEFSSVWFRFLVKYTGKGGQYSWDKVSVLLFADNTGRASSFIFDSPAEWKTSLRDLVPFDTTTPPEIRISNLLHCIIPEVVELYDVGVWMMRDVVRDIEKARNLSDYGGPDFGNLHDQARHAIHVSEVLEVAIDTVSRLVEQIGKPAEPNNPTDPIPRMVADSKCHLSMMENLHRRSQANEKRLSNEINLAFNIVAQRESREMKKMSQAMQSDSSAMKTVAMVTLIFFPATFVATIFSMSFFTTNDDAHGNPRWQMSEQAWIYLAVTIPLTSLTIAYWRLRQKPWNQRLKAWNIRRTPTGLTTSSTKEW